MKGLAKLSRNQYILIVVCIALLVVNVFLVMQYMSAASHKSDVEADIEDMLAKIFLLEGQYDIPGLRVTRDDWQQKLASESPFPASIDEKLVTYEIIDVVRRSYVGGYQIDPRGTKSTKINDHSYHVQTFSVTLTPGEELRRIINFVELIEELDYPTLKNDKFSLLAGETIWQLQFEVQIVTQ